MSLKISTVMILKFIFNTFLEISLYFDKDCSHSHKHQLNDNIVSVNNFTADSISISSSAFKHIYTVTSFVSSLYSFTSAFAFKCTYITANFASSFYFSNIVSAVS